MDFYLSVSFMRIRLLVSLVIPFFLIEYKGREWKRLQVGRGSKRAGFTWASGYDFLAFLPMWSGTAVVPLSGLILSILLLLKLPYLWRKMKVKFPMFYVSRCAQQELIRWKPSSWIVSTLQRGLPSPEQFSYCHSGEEEEAKSISYTCYSYAVLLTSAKNPVVRWQALLIRLNVNLVVWGSLLLMLPNVSYRFLESHCSWCQLVPWPLFCFGVQKQLLEWSTGAVLFRSNLHATCNTIQVLVIDRVCIPGPSVVLVLWHLCFCTYPTLFTSCLGFCNFSDSHNISWICTWNVSCSLAADPPHPPVLKSMARKKTVAPFRRQKWICGRK